METEIRYQKHCPERFELELDNRLKKKKTETGRLNKTSFKNI
jgi:hypothetical protein